MNHTGGNIITALGSAAGSTHQLGESALGSTEGSLLSTNGNNETALSTGCSTAFTTGCSTALSTECSTALTTGCSTALSTVWSTALTTGCSTALSTEWSTALTTGCSTVLSTEWSRCASNTLSTGCSNIDAHCWLWSHSCYYPEWDGDATIRDLLHSLILYVIDLEGWTGTLGRNIVAE